MTPIQLHQTEKFEVVETKDSSPIKVSRSLRAVIVHRGETPTSGHYVAYVRNPLFPFWYLIDDDIVRHAKFKDFIVKERSNIYMLVYSEQ